ncbi:MAG: M48 family metallopeptidase [Chitinophagaceae bacterium]|nr:M48 family metallopeptidase [Chitinophagaceae bacterium]
MIRTYSAVYYNSSGRFFNATIFLSSITLSIRYVDEHSESKDVYWLAENVLSINEEGLASTIIYQNKNGETERLLIHDPELVQAIKKHFSHLHFVVGWKHQLLGNTRNKIILFFSVIIFAILAGYFWFVPWLGERIARNISKEWEISMGEKMHQSMMGRYKIDSSSTKLINEFYKALHYKIDYPISITVVESKEINAFAVPGGNIVIYNSLLSRMQKPEELAALLSHEASHIAQRHSLRNIFRSMARKMFLLVIVGNESGIAGFLVNNADDLKGLEYSRSLETEADNHGIALMLSNNIDATGMVALMETLQEEAMGKESAAFLSTHPVFDNRIENIKQQIAGINTQPVSSELQESIFGKLQKRQRSGDW